MNLQQSKTGFSFLESVIILIGFIIIIFGSLFYLKTEPHLPLLICLAGLGIAGLFKKYSWKNIEQGIVSGISKGVQPFILLAVIGMLIAAWLYSGTIPTVIVYSLEIIHPSYLLITALIGCTLISSLIGSAFTTISTVGIALMGVAAASGVPLEWAAGAVICGACFGDKMSPMSDTTNFASGVAGVDIFSHIKHMSKTTIPSYLLSFAVFFYAGSSFDLSNASTENLAIISNAIQETVNISLLTLLSPLAVIVLAVLRKPVIPSLLAGIVTAGITGWLLQPDTSLAEFLTVLQNGTAFDVQTEQAASILNRGGLQSMMWSISLILIAFGLGGLMEQLGVIRSLMNGLILGIQTKGKLVLATVASAFGVNLVTGEQYLSILIPGQSLLPVYDKLSVDKKFLSRSLEDAGTLMNPLIPWGVSGAFFSQSLGVSVIDYLPYAIFLYTAPLFSILFGFLPDKRRSASQPAGDFQRNQQ
ncbi:Na+/H+ antiporter NhaC [Bacillus lacus]|uniref:Na+/H+ antiporter NhaC n=1 Tax=Metabacillus lacus TaxID=1983721 RepID=A0A7X2LZ28_9BACI|nr:Na+/H+ antiporter NhaC [Metabacillus lacus]MRX71512.1 Na+/H+ antiporter NhaC [Metabacillus lacus]